MQSFPCKKNPPVIVLRHRKENLKKCSLKGLEARDDFLFFTYPREELPFLESYLLLTPEAPPLSPEDGGCGLLILDGTWRYAEKMFRHVSARQPFLLRSLPQEWRTAYPRRQEDCPSPERGLASVEAIYAACRVLGMSTDGILDNYHWKDQFLDSNRGLL